MSTLLTEASRQAETLSIAIRALGRGLGMAEAARLAGLPESVLRDWLRSLERAYSRADRRKLSQHQTQPINASL
jgi:hypothetical protein